MEANQQKILDTAGNEIHVEVFGKDTILRGHDFLTKVSLEPPYGSQALQFSVTENLFSKGVFDICIDSTIVVKNLTLESANALLDQFSAAMTIQEVCDVFDHKASITTSSSQMPSLAGIISFLAVGAGIAVVALPIAGMARAGWELAVRYLN